MGYYTYYKLEIDSPKPTEIIKHLRQIDDEAERAFDEDGTPLKSVKWYEFEKSLSKLSLLYPNTLFTLYGDGEESDDVWKQGFYNGKTEYVKAERHYDDFGDDLFEG